MKRNMFALIAIVLFVSSANIAFATIQHTGGSGSAAIIGTMKFLALAVFFYICWAVYKLVVKLLRSLGKGLNELGEGPGTVRKELEKDER